MEQKNIRNFSIIAHIDHGKSTIADRILELTDAVTSREAKDQLLDSMDLERERGITIKLNSVQLEYNYNDEDYLLHLIDTPGHVDFTYEVSRSLAACEGAILVVDAAQGIEAQTLSNVYLAIENDLEIIPVINKIDLPNADIEKVEAELYNTFGFTSDEILKVSAKTGEGIEGIIHAVIDKVPSPSGDEKSPLRALIFDSYYDAYTGITTMIRVVDGSISKGEKIKFMSTGAVYDIVEVGVSTPKKETRKRLNAGEVGWVSASIKSIDDVHVGDTITTVKDGALETLPGYKEIKPMVFCGLYPIDSSKYNDLREALEKLKLSDSSLQYVPETSTSLGFGFRCGFLGLLHMDVTRERIEREYNIEMISTSPSVIYEVLKTNGETVMVDNPSKLPERVNISEIKEPYIKASIMSPSEYIGAITKLCEEKRGIHVNMEFIDTKRVNIYYELPLSEIVYDFFDKLKSTTKGYASFDYDLIGYKPSDLVKMDILLNGEVVDALSVITYRAFAFNRGKNICDKLKETIPRQMFEVPIQAAIGNKIIARTNIKAMRKNVLAKCYGGDVSRKKKLLKKQKEGKKKMKQIGSVEIPSEAFLSILSMDSE